MYHCVYGTLQSIPPDSRVTVWVYAYTVHEIRVYDAALARTESPSVGN